MNKLLQYYVLLIISFHFISCDSNQYLCNTDFKDVYPDTTFYYLDTCISEKNIDKNVNLLYIAQQKYLEKVNSLKIDSALMLIAKSGCVSSFCQDYLRPIIRAWQSDQNKVYHSPYFFNGRFLVDSLLAICSYEGYYISTPLKNQEYIEALSIMDKQDQFYRVKGLNSLTNNLNQVVLDSLNRIMLDSLFNVFGFPHVYMVGYKGHDIAWRVLHHSEDCDWNRKWFLRFLDDYYSYPFEGYSLFRTYERLYAKEMGWCSDDNEYINLCLHRIVRTEFEKYIE